MSDVEAWRCPVCRQMVSTPFCAVCGEKHLAARELTLRALLHEIAVALTNIDGRLIRSFRLLVTRPGALTVAFAQGLRKPYIGPFPLFLLANVVFFAVQSATGLRVFSTALDMHLHDQAWSDLAQMLVDNRLSARGTSLESYAPVFDQAVSVNAKSLIGLMVPPFALLLPPVFFRARKPFAVHAVFSLHFYAFLLLLFCAPLAVLAVDVLLGGDGVLSPRADDAWSLALLAGCAVYLYCAIGAVYQSRGAARVAQTFLLAVAAVGIHLFYRFALFLITLYST